jgi:hypothetical protein
MLRLEAHDGKITHVKIQTLACIAAAMLLSACGGSGTGANPVTASLALVSGTLTIGSRSASAQGNFRKPEFISPSTGHAAVFIDGAAANSGSTTSCSAATGTGTGCTISWSAQLTVPASHTFAVETDTGANAPANTVLSEGAASYAVVAGSSNTLATLSLNGAVKKATFAVTACSGTTPNSLCNGTVVLADAANNAIAYTGSTAVPTTGNSPSSGNVFDNAAVTFVSATPANGLVTGTAQTASSNVFSTYATNTLTVSGVNTTGTYTYQVTCGSSATGTFGITVGGASTPSLAVSSAELAALSTAVSYPAAGVTVNATAPVFTCTAGNISSTSGTIPVN